MSQQCFMTSQSDLLPMMTATMLLALGQSESGLTVVVPQAIGHGDGQTEPDDTVEQGNDLLGRDLVAQESAAEIIGTQSLRRAFGPDLDAAVRQQFELQSVAGCLADHGSQAVGLARRPFDIDVHTDQIGFRGRFGSWHFDGWTRSCGAVSYTHL